MDDQTKTQLGRFIVVGVGATLSDALVYGGTMYIGLADSVHAALPVALHTLLPTAYEVAKSTSFFVGTCVSFVLNKLWTFESKDRDARQAGAFFVLYGLTFVLNVGANFTTLQLGRGAGLPARLVEVGAFLVATGCSTVANFIGQKFWVFRKGGPPQSSG